MITREGHGFFFFFFTSLSIRETTVGKQETKNMGILFNLEMAPYVVNTNTPWLLYMHKH